MADIYFCKKFFYVIFLSYFIFRVKFEKFLIFGSLNKLNFFKNFELFIWYSIYYDNFILFCLKLKEIIFIMNYFL